MREAELGMGSRHCCCFVIARLVVKRWGVDSQTQCVGSGKEEKKSSLTHTDTHTHVTASG